MCVGLALYAWRFRAAPATEPFLAVMACGALWSAGNAFYAASGSVDGMLFWASVSLIPISALPVAFLLMAWRHYKQSHWWNGRIVALLLVAPAITSYLSCTNNPLFTGTMTLNTSGPLPYLDFSNGPWYTVHVAYSYSLLAASLLLLVASLRHAQSLYRRQTITLIIGALFPILLDVLVQFNFIPLHAPAPLAFTITGLINTWALRRYGILDTAPIAHNLVIRHMSELMLMVDAKGRIVDLNPAAAAAFNIEPEEAIGSPAEGILPQWSELQSDAAGEESGWREIALRVGGENRVYSISLSTIRSSRGDVAGRLALLHNVSERKEVEEALRQANAHLQEQLSRNKDLQARLQDQATRDPLTGLYNRRYLEERLEQELAKARREKYPVSVIMADIDHFKQINDTWGHEAGDNVLKAVSALFMKHARGSDVVCRYGGEEFMLVLPGVAPDVAFGRAEEWRKLCQELRAPNGADALQCTLSFGVASYPADGTATADVVRAADAALYAAKAGGRNRTVMAGASLLTAVLKAV